MPSSLFSKPAGSQGSGNILQRFAEFKRSMQGKDPEAIVKQMLADGRMTQQQFEQLKSQASNFMTLLR